MKAEGRIPATTVDVERVFSKGRIILSHTRNRLSPQSTRALMCVGEWSRLGFLKTKQIATILKASDKALPIPKPTEDDVQEMWDNVLLVMEREKRRAASQAAIVPPSS